MNNRAEVREFLTSRRAKITPEQAGVPQVGQRRVLGLRRGEVAALAGMSVEYYAKLERGWRIHVEAFDWNCAQHITPRFTAVELEDLIAPTRVELDRLQMENLALKARLERARAREITP